MKKRSFINLISLTFMLAFALLFTGCARQASGYAYQEATGYDVSKTVVSGMAGGTDEELEGLFTPVKSNLELDINNKFADNADSEDELDFKEDENSSENNESESEEAAAGEEGNTAEEEQNAEDETEPQAPVDQPGENETEPQAPVDQVGENETEPQAPVDQLGENDSQEPTGPDNQPNSGNNSNESEIPGSEEIITDPAQGGTGSGNVEYVPIGDIIENGENPDDYDTIVVPGEPGNGSENESGNPGQTEPTQNTQETQPEESGSEVPETQTPTETETEDQTESTTDVPVIQVIENINGGVYIQWTNVKGATEYQVTRKLSGSTTTIAQTAENSVVITNNLDEGTEYIYSVIPIINGKAGSKDEVGVKHMYVAAPVITDIYDDNGYIKIEFSLSGTLSGQRVMVHIYRNSGAGFQKLYSSSGTDSYVDRNAKKGIVYQYEVIKSCGEYESAPSQVVRGCAFDSTTVRTVGIVGGGIEISWDPVSGADFYIIKRADKFGGIANVIGSSHGTNYVDTDYHIGGNQYRYFIFPILNGDIGCTTIKTTGAGGTSITYAGIANVYEAYSVEQGITISWSYDNRGGDTYTIFRNDGNGWNVIANVSGDSTSYTDETAEVGKYYTYAVGTGQTAASQLGGGTISVQRESIGEQTSTPSTEPGTEPETDPPTTEPETESDDNSEETEETTES